MPAGAASPRPKTPKKQRKQRQELSPAERERRRRQAQMAAQSKDRTGFRIDEICARNGIGRQLVYDEINRGKLRAKKIGRATIITSEDEQAWLDGLPLISPSPSDEH